MKTYGTLRYNAGQWLIPHAEPHVIIKLKALFNKIRKTQTDNFEFPDTTENARDLQWFMERYPLAISEHDADHLYRRKDEHIRLTEAMEQLLRPDYVPRQYQLKRELRHYQAQGTDLYLANGVLLLGDDVGLGKEQPVDEPVLTPTGWKKIGDISVGDFVIGSNGKPTEVLGVYPQGVKDVYKLTFSDGSWTRCGLDHLWAFDHWCGGKRKERIVIKASDLVNGFIDGRMSSQGRVTQLKIGPGQLKLPMLSSYVDFEAVSELPIPSYLLGQLIANGATSDSTPVLTVNSDDADEIITKLKTSGCQIGTIKNKGGCYAISILNLTQKIRDLGLYVKSGEKFIPNVYKMSSFKDRVNLLHGLMDGDGSISLERNKVTYHTTSKTLAEDVRELVECLGGVASLREYNREHQDKATEYHVRVRIPQWIQNPFSTKRKGERFKTTDRSTNPTRSFQRIEKVDRMESVCIKVRAADSLYLTRHAIVTHNTAQAIASFCDQRVLPALVVVQTHLPTQWKEEIGKFCDVSVHLIKGTKPYSLPPADVYIMKYSCLRGWVDTFAMGTFKSVIFDEVQELRHDGTDKYSAARTAAKSVSHVLGMSATPIYNYGDEIFNILNLMKEGCLGARDEFLREWCGGYNVREIKNPKALGTYLRESFLFLRRTRKDVGRELQPVNKIVHTVETDHKKLDSIDALARQLAMQTVTGEFTQRGMASRELSMLVRHATGVSKAKSVADYVRILLENGEPVLLAGWHRDVYDIWLKELEAYNPVLYTGTESAVQKNESKRKFMDGETNLMIISLRSGVGLDGLQGRCKIVVIGELDWSPQVHHQLIGRVDRDGQTEQVTAIYLVSNDGSDPEVIDTLGLKASQSNDIINPNGVLEEQVSNGEIIKRLAQKYLERKKHDKQD